MHLNATPPAPPRKPCLRDLAQLTGPSGLLPAAVVPLLPLKQLKRRANEIAATHPQYREETPLVLAYETQRRRFAGGLVASVTQTVARLMRRPKLSLASAATGKRVRVDAFWPGDVLVPPKRGGAVRVAYKIGWPWARAANRGKLRPMTKSGGGALRVSGMVSSRAK